MGAGTTMNKLRIVKGLARGDRKWSLYVFMRVRATIVWREIVGRRETAP